MRIRWTSEDISKLAPDAGSIAAGRKLATARQWLRLGASDTHLWGELQGSGAKPYQTCIDREGPAFHCSCPSRKFPCKHGLALAYLEVEQPVAFTAQEAPEWVAEWIRKRADRDERKQARVEAAAKPVDAETAARRAKDQQRRALARLDKAQGGISFVSQWLQDAIRQGLASQAEQPYRYWDELAARTVDAQIPGLARHFRQFPALRHSRSDWQTPFLETLVRLHLLCRAFAQYDALGPEWRGDLDAALGMPQAKEDLLATAGVSDRWCVLGIADGEDDGLRFQRTWLQGEQSGQTALLLDFAARGQVLPGYAPPGGSFTGELVFYPSAWPQRALLKERTEPAPDHALVGGVPTVQEALERYVTAAAQLPWIERIALPLCAVTPRLHDGDWFVVDAVGEALPLSPDCLNAWELFALSGGRPLDLFAEFDGEALLPLTVADAAGVHVLPQGKRRGQTRTAAPAYLPWRQTLTTVLLGAEQQRQALTADGPAGELLARLYPQGALPVASDVRSRTLLDAASVLALYRRGAHAPLQIAPQPVACADDELAAPGAVAAGQLRHILAGQDTGLLNEWLAVAANAGKRCPAELLPSLLDGMTQIKVRHPQLVAVLGRRGVWLAQWQADWRALLPANESDSLAELVRRWEEATGEERRSALSQLRARDPEDARQRLAGVFSGEPAAERAALLATLERGLGTADEAFLESCLTDKSQEVRQRAAELLSRLPTAVFNRQVCARAEAWLRFKPRTGLLSRLGGKKGEIELNLPEGWEPAWNQSGLVEKAPRGKGAKAWWLEQILALVPPRHWSTAWQLSPAECLALTDGHEWREALLSGWLQATLTQQDADWALALLDATGISLDAALRLRLWQVLDPQTRQRCFSERLPSAKGAALIELLHLLPALERPWDMAFSRLLLDTWRRLVSSSAPVNDYRVYPLLREAAMHLVPQTLPHFEQLFARELAEDHPWHKILLEVAERLRFRHALHAALTNDSNPPGGTCP